MTNFDGRSSIDTPVAREIVRLKTTQDRIINHVWLIDGRLRKVEESRRRSSRDNIRVSMVIDWRMVTALVLLIAGLMGLINIEQLQNVTISVK